ncbi:RNA polymerase sigma factor [Nannocystis punicea]|uniref:RNA polymerase sigma factor n=1 Tax=Nannocystis punicea TaxID=2995304 RepID=A0ABY7GZK0_9BACT|nr:RNA polymerase sigma factor [Nannocystis poenicansa]WAS92377.1 RNA polymerase sigma factor [Nannocystis poenicansa]
MSTVPRISAMKHDDRSDEALHDALLAGDKHAGAVLYDRYFLKLRGYFINKVADPSTGDDLTQKTFEVVVFKPETYEKRSGFRAYLFGVAHNVLRSDYRQRKRAADRRADVEDIEALPVAQLGPGVSTLAAQKAAAQRLVEALRQLPIHQQSLFEMYYWQELSGSEIAEIFGCKEATVRGRLRLAKRALLEKLGLPHDSLAELLRAMRDMAGWTESIKLQLAEGR